MINNKDSAVEMPAVHWDFPSNEIYTGSDQVHVWRTTLDQNKATILELSTLLAPDERRRAEKYHSAKDCNRFITARGVLRKILSSYLHVSPDELQFVYNECGKPALSIDQNCRALNFNLSHSNDLALYAVAWGRSVGVDIEYIRKDFATIDIAEHFFSKDEVKSLKSAPIDLRTEAFFKCWSRKESYIKAIGMGVSYSLDGFTVSLAPDIAPALLKVDADELEPNHWRMYDLEAAEGYAASLIIENPPITLRQFQWIG
jgi:4'-phosphopantetheinyl transferase